MNTPSRLDDRRPFHSILFFASTFFPRIFSPPPPFFPLFLTDAGGKHARKMKTDLTWKTLASPVMAYLPPMFFYSEYTAALFWGCLLGISVYLRFYCSLSLSFISLFSFSSYASNEKSFISDLFCLFSSSILVTYRYNIIIFLFLLIC